MNNLINNIDFWRALVALAFFAGVIVMLVPALSEWVARLLHAHAIASTGLYRALARAIRMYRRVHERTMEETA